MVDTTLDRDWQLNRERKCDQWILIELFTNYTKMSILAFLSLLRENKKYSDKLFHSVGIQPGPLITSDSKFSTILSAQTSYLFVRLRLKAPHIVVLY